jgi:hypothetical protein
LNFDKNPRLETVVGFLLHLRRRPEPGKHMSKINTQKAKNKTVAPRSEVGPSMAGSEILVAGLEREGVDTIFAYPGGASMEIHQALTRSKIIRVILPRHERAAASPRKDTPAPRAGPASA